MRIRGKPAFFRMVIAQLRKNARTGGGNGWQRLVAVLLRVIIKVIFKRLVWIIFGSAGVPVLISLVLAIFAGGAIIAFAVVFDWDMSGDYQDDANLRDQFIQAAEASIDHSKEEQIPYLLPWPIAASLERVRLEKAGDGIFPKERVEELKPQFTYESFPFIHHRYTVITTCGPDGCKSYQTEVKVTRPRERLLSSVRTWDALHSITYGQRKETEFHQVAKRTYRDGQYTKTFTDYLKRELYWEKESETHIADYSHLDAAFVKHSFQPDDRLLFAEIARSIDPSLTLPFDLLPPPNFPLWEEIDLPYTGNVSGTWGWPVPASSRISSWFGWRNRGGLTGEFHQGIDIPPKVRGVDGDPVHVAADGEVTRAEWSTGGYGWVVYVRHEGGYQTRYAHLSRLLTREGKIVKLGDVVGLMGNTGDSTGTHLHFELRKNGRPIDPLSAVSP